MTALSTPEPEEIIERLRWTGNCANCNLRGINLEDAELVVFTPPSDSDLFSTDTAVEIGVNLENANLSQAQLSRANLARAYLRDADLEETQLRDTNFKASCAQAS